MGCKQSKPLHPIPDLTEVNEEVHEDGLSSVHCVFRNKGIFRKNGKIYLPLNDSSYSVTLIINDKKQFFSLHSDEFFLYRNGDLLNSAFVGDIKHTTMVTLMPPVNYSETVINSVIPFFYHNIFVPWIGSSKLLTRYDPEVVVSTINNDFTYSPTNPLLVPTDIQLTESTAYGCFHMDVTLFDEKYAIIDENKLYYATFDHGCNMNNAIFQNFRCKFEYDSKTENLHLLKRDDNVENPWNGFVYFDRETITSIPHGSHIIPLLNNLLERVATYYCVNDNAFEVFGEEGKLISPREELLLIEGLKENNLKTVVDICNVFAQRYVPDLILQWSMVFAIQDAHEDTDGKIDVMCALMRNYRRKPQYNPKVFVKASFDRLQTPPIAAVTCTTYNAYSFTFDSSKNFSRFDFNSDGTVGVLYTYTTGTDDNTRSFILTESAEDNAILFVCGNEVRITKYISETDLIQKVLIDGVFIDFWLLSSHERAPDALYITKELPQQHVQRLQGRPNHLALYQKALLTSTNSHFDYEHDLGLHEDFHKNLSVAKTSVKAHQAAVLKK